MGIQELSDALAISERRRREAQRLSGVGFWELNYQNGTLYWSEEIFAIYGLEANALDPNYEIFVSLIFDDDREFVDAAYKASVKDGTEYNIRYRIKAGPATKWIEARGVTYYDSEGNPERSIGTAQDISEIMDAQQALEHLALHDALTGLPNRKLFSDRISAALNLARRHGFFLGVLFIDLDNFKRINDRQGHSLGDEVLVGIARHLEHSVRAEDTFARLGGDEFVGLLTGENEQDIQDAVQRVKQSIEGTYSTEFGSFAITASIGVTIYPHDSDEPDELLRHADHAMYEAKESGKSRICYFDAKRHQSNRSRNQLLVDIEKAIENDEFILHFQPRICLRDGSLSGAEALLRWFRPDGPTPPVEVITAIRGTSLEWELDTWVMKEALAQVRRFRAYGLQGPFSLNVMPSTIENRELPSLLKQFLDDASISGENLEIEVLEVSSIRDFDQANEILRVCKELGIRFSLDDFGTGYASLTYFHSLPVDKLKIDQLFIRTLLSDGGSLALVKSILAISDANDCFVVAEGVESYSIASALRHLGCDYGQGFGLAKPMASDDYIAWAHNWDAQVFLDRMAASG
ncbi:GGDEF domain-containing protein [Halomonas aestuarii]|uniref:GGDEF domain-containing protein n=1 Tax=Halomonas aestuarii TaxID=1897729 RepID=A0A1J0VK46_9GAMM|nr:GGDEF domain-containing protein [Halomonas aestuarii]